ncbi:acyl carrier protein [Azospirillum sp. Vi22]|uniref:acyl carrier protein n=1 Tax=Azospirillum baldaniorum TaxID=1064539 RepID=UPI00157B4554|nr:acyl carrier protein [Azospirillum baldaniorum]NUB10212.1 acyl carrier protein [Azospirillum baldaniorum]
MRQPDWQIAAGTAPRGGDAQAVSAADIRALLADSGWLATDASALSDEDDLYAAGLTSHGSVNLMLALEERYGVEFPDHLLRRRTFESIAAIRSAVAGLLDGAPGGMGAGGMGVG